MSHHTHAAETPGARKRLGRPSHDHDREHDEQAEHGHSHGLVDRSILRSRAGVKAVAASLAILAIAAGVQLAIFALSHSVALLADLVHNFGDALTAVPASSEAGFA